jgi:hypothetical protein
MEVSGAPNLLEGYIEAEVYEVGGVAPTNIIRIDQDWRVRVHWGLEGCLKSMICGAWCLHLHLESIGEGPELSLPVPNKVRLDPCGNGEYDYDFVLRKGKVTADHCSTPYKPVVTVTYENECELPGPIAGFVELGIIQFYDPGKRKP